MPLQPTLYHNHSLMVVRQQPVWVTQATVMAVKCHQMKGETDLLTYLLTRKQR